MSLASGRGQCRIDALAVPHVDDLRRLTDLQQVQGVGVVVDIGDRLPSNLDDDVAFLQACLFSWAAADDAAEQQSLRIVRVVGNRPGEYANAGAAAAALHLLFDLRELRRVDGVADAANDRRGKINDAIE